MPSHASLKTRREFVRVPKAEPHHLAESKPQGGPDVSVPVWMAAGVVEAEALQAREVEALQARQFLPWVCCRSSCIQAAAGLPPLQYAHVANVLAETELRALQHRPFCMPSQADPILLA